MNKFDLFVKDHFKSVNDFLVHHLHSADENSVLAFESKCHRFLVMIGKAIHILFIGLIVLIFTIGVAWFFGIIQYPITGLYECYDVTNGVNFARCMVIGILSFIINWLILMIIFIIICYFTDMKLDESLKKIPMTNNDI